MKFSQVVPEVASKVGLNHVFGNYKFTRFSVANRSCVFYTQARICDNQPTQNSCNLIGYSNFGIECHMSTDLSFQEITVQKVTGRSQKR